MPSGRKSMHHSCEGEDAGSNPVLAFAVYSLPRLALAAFLAISLSLSGVSFFARARPALLLSGLLNRS